MVAMKATIYHWNKYVQEFPQEALWSFSLTPRCFSIRFLLRSRARRAPLWMRTQNLLQNGIVIQSYSHWCKTRCDVMFLCIPFYKTKVKTILAFWCNCVKKNCKCICDLLTMHTWWESIWWRKNSMSCHNVMYNTDHKSFKVARYSFSRSIPPKFERKLRRHKQRFGKIDTTVVLDKDENLLWSR